MAPSFASPGALRRGAALALSLAALARPARAADEPSFKSEAEPSRVTRQERPFAFAVDPSTPSAGVWSAGYAFGLGSGVAADRPLPVNMASASGSSTFSVAVGATDRLAPFLSATLADAGTSSPTRSYAAGLTWQVTHPAAPLRLTVTAGGMHEGESGANGATALVAASLEEGPLRFVANVRADKVFAAGRDSVDYLVVLGTAWRLGTAFRLGAEYVGQDLEETFADEAEGGARHALGPTLSLDLDGGRYQVAVGSGFGLTARSPRAVARGTVAVNF